MGQAAKARMRERIAQATRARDALAETAKNGVYRQTYHFMPPAGWINDPNGCIYYNGKYHVYYQHNPYAGKWGSMFWGHAASVDLVNWEHLPIALAPSEDYDDHPQGGCFSGSTIEHGNEFAMLYTATTERGNGFEQTQCLATSTDGGLTFEKYAGNPVIQALPESASPDFRDPRLIRNGSWYHVVLGVSLGAGAWNKGEGAAVMYRSKDLRRWEYQGIIARSGGKLGTMWECPDLFYLDGKWVLAFSPMFLGERKTVYLVGDMDFDNARFTPQNTGETDWGGEYYAPQSMAGPNGSHVMMAWQNGWDWMPWWRDFGPTEPEGWCGCLALPRTVKLDEKQRLVSQPVGTLSQLRGEKAELAACTVDGKELVIPCADPVHFELELSIDLRQTTADRLILDMRAGAGKRTRLVLNLKEKQLIFDRSEADDGHSHGQKSCPLLLEDPAFTLRVFSDTCSIELFTDGGRTCMSHLVYPTHQEQGIYLRAEGGRAALAGVTTWGMNPAKMIEWKAE